jgi:hypothetical protein
LPFHITTDDAGDMPLAEECLGSNPRCHFVVASELCCPVLLAPTFANYTKKLDSPQSGSASFIIICDKPAGFFGTISNRAPLVFRSSGAAAGQSAMVKFHELK